MGGREEGKGTVVVGPCAVHFAGARIRLRACKIDNKN